MFNAFHGAHRQIYVDVANERRVDVFVGMFSMCHEIPIAERLHHEPLTVPLAELLLTKLQIVGTIERCRTDLVHYPLGARERDLIDARLAHLWDVFEAAPRTSKWRWRAKVGERKRWYEEPEEEGQPD
jgi:hypothetical protein